MESHELATATERIIENALARGADQAEAFGILEDAKELWYRTGKFTSIGSERIGFGIRVAKEKSLGFASASGLDSKNHVKALEMALNIASTKLPDPNWISFPNKKNPSQVEQTYDKEIEQLDPRELTNSMIQMVRPVEKMDSRIHSVDASIITRVRQIAVSNSEGISVTDKGTYLDASISVNAKDQNEYHTGEETFSTRKLKNIVFSEVGVEAASKAISMFNAKPMKTQETTVLFEPSAIQPLVFSTIGSCILAGNVQEKRSAFVDKLGQTVGSEILTIVDDGTLPGGQGTSKIDHEGSPTQKTSVIKNGVLEGYLYDSYSAFRENKESTGNALRSGMTDKPYTLQPKPRITNLIIKEGIHSRDQLISETKDGTIISDSVGAFLSNRVTTEFSITPTVAYKIRNGEISHSIKGIIIADSMTNILRKITGIANNAKQQVRVKTPTIRTENIVITGKK
jgi:PmbA protein